MMVALLTVGSALGSTFTDVPSVETLVSESPSVVRGTVTITNTKPCSLGLCTTYTVSVSQTWRGPGRETVRVTLPGGRSGDLTQRVSGLPLWSRGDEVVLFLDDRGQARWTSLFTVARSPVDGRTATIVYRELATPQDRRLLTSVQDLRDQVSLAESTRP